MTAREAYEVQREARAARWATYHALDAARDFLNGHESEPVKKAKRAEAEAVAAAAAANEAIGGKAYRVVTSKLEALQERIAKLNKKAAKLGTGEITLTVTDEKDQEIRRRSLVRDQEIADIYGAEATSVKEVIDYVYVILSGAAPRVEGYVFIATLDHEATHGHESEEVGIRRVPIWDKALAKDLEALDLTGYRHAKNICDHCGYERRRLQTYLVYEVEGGEIRQVGSTCLRDYTGANSPERAASWAEWLAALDYDLWESDCDSGFSVAGEGSGRLAIPTEVFLTHVAAMMRERGWQPRWIHDDYSDDYIRNDRSTADSALANIQDRGKDWYKEPTDEDAAEAHEALEWVREDLAEREDLDEFQGNLVTYTRSDYLPEKGDGYIAYAIMALRRERERALLAERAAGSEHFGAVKERIKDLTFTVTFVREMEGNYGVTYLTKGYTPDGNLILWWGSRGLEQGATYTASATIKKHEVDSYADDAKVTVVTNLRGITEVAQEAAV